ncbi:hypothetical protein QMA71_27290 [Pseudomonas otitidis]|nr:hypothetical protein [Pseudomonas otitidis]MDI6529256.1 hypothetical protein [Pseudomonas otitidis]
MPIPPQPLTFSCSRCSWQKTTIPLSDALVLGRDWFAQCPQCNCELQRRAATKTEVLRARLEQFFQ